MALAKFRALPARPIRPFRKTRRIRKLHSQNAANSWSCLRAVIVHFLDPLSQLELWELDERLHFQSFTAMYKIIGADGNEYGPVSAEQIRQWITEGRLNAASRIQLEGSGEWKLVREVAEFSPQLPALRRPFPFLQSPPGVRRR